MGGSAARPADVLGAYRPSKAAIENAKLARLTVQLASAEQFAWWASKRRGSRKPDDITWGLLLLRRMDEPALAAILRQLRREVNRRGYTAAARNDAVVLEAMLRRAVTDQRKKVDATAWTCPSCRGATWKFPSIPTERLKPGAPTEARGRECVTCGQVDMTQERRKRR